MPESAQASEATITVGEAAGEPYTLPVEDVLTGRLFVTGKSGSGKSNTGSVIAEELLERGHPLLAVDVDGEYWGLKEAYEVLHVGATEECDLQVGPEHAGKLAELALEQHVPIVLDVSGYVDGDTADALVRETARELFAREQQAMQPFLMLVEEIHEYIPQQGGLDETGEMLIRIAKRGRKRGLGIAGLSQRPADVKKDFITQADCLVWHRLTWDNDTDVVARVVGADHADSVSDLGDGEAFVQADWADADIETVQFRRKRTFDAGATPGLDDVERPDLKSIDGDLVDELEAISDQHDRRQDRIAELEALVGEKDERIAELEADLEQAEDLQRLGEAIMNAAGGGDGSAVDAEQQELLEEKTETIAELREQIDALETTLADVREDRDELREEVQRLQGVEQRVAAAERIEQQLEEARDVLGVDVSDAGAAAAAGTAEPDVDVEALRDRISELEAENDRLRERADAGDEDSLQPLEGYEAFLDDEDVRDAIEAAKGVDRTSPRYIKGVIAAIVDAGGPVAYEEVAERLDLSTTGEVSKAASVLEARKLIEKDSRDDGMYVDLNTDGLNEVREAAARQRKTEELMEEL